MTEAKFQAAQALRERMAFLKGQRDELRSTGGWDPVVTLHRPGGEEQRFHLSQRTFEKVFDALLVELAVEWQEEDRTFNTL